MDPVLAVDFSRTVADLPRGAYSAAIDLTDRGGVAGQATFFMKRADAIRTLRETYLDQQGGATAEYLYALVDEHAIPAALADELETANVGVAEAFVCGNDTVILGRDALEDACAEWRGAVVEEA